MNFVIAVHFALTFIPWNRNRTGTITFVSTGVLIISLSTGVEIDVIQGRNGACQKVIGLTAF